MICFDVLSHYFPLTEFLGYSYGFIHAFFWLTYLYTVELITCSMHFYGF